MRSLRPLTKEEETWLETELEQAKGSAEWKRIFVILSYNEGHAVEDLARLTRLSPWTVEEYLKKYSSEKKTKNDPRGGSASKLNVSESKELEEHLSQTTYLKVKGIVAYVKRRFGREYSRTGMTAWLKEHGFTFKRPEKIPGKLDPDKQAQFIETYQKLRDSLGSDEELYFIDAVHPEYQSQAAFGWIKKGECKTLQTTGKQTRLHFMGAVALKGMKVMVREYQTIDADSVIRFLQALEAESSAKQIHVVLDNAPAHKNHKVREFVATSRIRLHYLPPYSPNLNPIERLWKIFREMILYNRFFPTWQDFFAEVRNFFGNRVYNLGRLLRQRINDNFQIIRPNPIKLA